MTTLNATSADAISGELLVSIEHSPGTIGGSNLPLHADERRAWVRKRSREIGVGKENECHKTKSHYETTDQPDSPGGTGRQRGGSLNRQLRQRRARQTAPGLGRYEDRQGRSQVGDRGQRFRAQQNQRPETLRGGHLPDLHKGGRQPQRRLRGSEVQAHLWQRRPGGRRNLAGQGRGQLLHRPRRHADSKVGKIRNVRFEKIQITSGTGVLIQAMP
jgi:hypothetical protein